MGSVPDPKSELAVVFKTNQSVSTSNDITSSTHSSEMTPGYVRIAS